MSGFLQLASAFHVYPTSHALPEAWPYTILSGLLWSAVNDFPSLHTFMLLLLWDLLPPTVLVLMKSKLTLATWVVWRACLRGQEAFWKWGGVEQDVLQKSILAYCISLSPSVALLLRSVYRSFASVLSFKTAGGSGKAKWLYPGPLWPSRIVSWLDLALDELH